MVSKSRILEVYKYFVYHEPTNEELSIKRFKILRERFNKIIKSKKLKSVQIAMGSDIFPIQEPIYKMTDNEFDEFIDDYTSGNRRKEIYNKYSVR